MKITAAGSGLEVWVKNEDAKPLFSAEDDERERGCDVICDFGSVISGVRDSHVFEVVKDVCVCVASDSRAALVSIPGAQRHYQERFEASGAKTDLDCKIWQSPMLAAEAIPRYMQTAIRKARKPRHLFSSSQ